MPRWIGRRTVELVIAALLFLLPVPAVSADQETATPLGLEERYLYIVVGFDFSKNKSMENVTAENVFDGELRDARNLVPQSFLDQSVEFVSSGRHQQGMPAAKNGRQQTWFIFDRESNTQYSIPPVQAKLEQIADRGRYLAEYDKAAYISTDFVLAKKLNLPGNGTFAARKLKNRWEVVFGKLTDDNSSFTIFAKARQKGRKGKYSVKVYEPPISDDGAWLEYARAIDIAGANIVPIVANYNTVVFEDENNLIVYFLPGRTEQDVYPLGGDYRVIVARDSFDILENTNLHKSVLNMTIPQNVAATVSASVLFSAPVESEVFYVLQWSKRKIPHYVVAGNFLYKIATDGEIKLNSFMYHKDYGIEWTEEIPGRFLAGLRERASGGE